MKNEFDVQYQEMLKNILETGIEEKNERTGHVCKSLPGMTMKFDLEKGFPILTLRKIPLKVFIAEQIWFLMGRRDLEFLQKFTKIWDNFVIEVKTAERRPVKLKDGSNYWIGSDTTENVVEAAYGYRWRKHFNRDQIKGLVDLLSADHTSRHGVVLMWDPGDDGLSNGTKKKNVPCPYTYTVQIIGGRLCLHLIIRSNDMMLGNPHDVSGFALLAHFLAQKIGVGVGTMTISISNAHIYDIHFDQAKEIVSRKIVHEPVKFNCPQNAFDRAENGDESLVEEIFVELKKNYNPQEALGKIEIVL
ncbi:thymidylate synthase [Candidatus Gracilibacteria bacterium]|nr:thymidylate synthase [Candidatus Gracilibacteria bacterium]